MSEIDETIKEFLVESFENLETLDRELLKLESDPKNLDTINTIFRIVHTVKGTCGFFEFKKLESVSHVGENLLDSLRSEKIAVNEPIITALLQLTDTLREVLTNIAHTGSEGDKDYSPLVQLLTTLNKPLPKIEAIVETSPASEPVVESEEDELQKIFAAAKHDYDSETEPTIEPVTSVEIAAAVVESIAPPSESKVVASGKSADPAPTEVVSEARKSEVVETSLRVDVGVLDKLMNLVGELVLTRNQILQFNKSKMDGEFAKSSQRLNLITSELQDGVMRTRMQPIATIWNKLPRIVRDIAHSCGKLVKLEMDGKDTELDKTIIEAIKDPLTHVIRNAVDHGIESPEKRLAAGKPAEGTLSMRAFHEGGQVIIELVDDGGGLNLERIRAKALERDLISRDKAATMSDAEVQRLIFLPGFSTAEKVTNLSGRGVGMDVVRSNIEKIGGVVDVSSRYGFETRFTIKIPLTLAIIPALIVTTGGNRYAIPQVNLLELVRLEGKQIHVSLETIHSADFYRLRGTLLPLVYLNDQLGLTSNRLETVCEDDVMNLVVVRADNHQFGLVVNAIHDTEEIVVKPLGRLLKGITAFAGATIMGDGQVALILDIVGIGRSAHITKKTIAAQNADKANNTEEYQERKKMFVFEIDQNKRAAVPLEQVYRLEEFQASKLERAGDQIVVQYRNGILPLVDLRVAQDSAPIDKNAILKAFVHQSGGKFVGFVFQRVVDIVEQAVSIESPSRTKGLFGSAVIQDKVTDLLDLSAYLKAANLTEESTAEQGGVL